VPDQFSTRIRSTPMTDAMGPLARGTLLTTLVLLVGLVAPVAATAHVPTVHTLRGEPFAGEPWRTLDRPPAHRFRAAPRSSASSVKVANVSADGTRTNGKILAVDPGAGSYSCSGTAINTPSRSIVLTAGHCVVEGGEEGRRIAFVPAYDHGKRPFGAFPVESIYVMPQWRRSESPAFDLAALRVKPNKLGMRLTDVVGARGYAIGKSRLAAFQIFGYPAARAGGEELRSCRAHGLGFDRLTARFAGPPTMPASCDMAAGASGGAWLFDGRYVSGVTSYSYQGRPTQLFSPYFGPEIGGFLRALP